MVPSDPGREFPLALWSDRGEPLAVAGTNGTLGWGSTLFLWETSLSRGANPKLCPQKWGGGYLVFFPCCLVPMALLLHPCCSAPPALPWSSRLADSWCCWR